MILLRFLEAGDQIFLDADDQRFFSPDARAAIREVCAATDPEEPGRQVIDGFWMGLSKRSLQVA